jgi:adenylosuccinate synthase
MAVKYSVDLCGITHIALTLLDVLSGLDHVRICTGYKLNGSRLEYFRADMDTLAEVEPVYETLPGWKQEIGHVRRWDDLPAEAKQYVKRLETLAGAPIRMVSVGPERTATLIR